MEEDNRFENKDNIDRDTLELIMCKFLINLPPEEKQFPRLFIHIKDACYYYADNCFAIPPEITNVFTKKFAYAVFECWPLLNPDHSIGKAPISQFDKLWREYKQYIEKIPSFGAIIFNQTMDKILFNVYFNPREDVVKSLDFPKGKAN